MKENNSLHFGGEESSRLLDVEHIRLWDKLRMELAELGKRLDAPEVQRLPYEAHGGEKEIGEQMKSLQKEMIPRIYQNTKFESNYLKYHSIQTEARSCQLASASNVLKAFRGAGYPTERQIAESIGKVGDRGDIWPAEVINYLRQDVGLDVVELKNSLEGIDILIRGGKLVLIMLPPKYYMPHTVVVSGVKINNGQLEFYLNDPSLASGGMVGNLSLNNFIDIVIPYSFNKLQPNYAVMEKKPLRT